MAKRSSSGSDRDIRIEGTPGGTRDGIRLFWDGVGERDWARLLAVGTRTPLEQTWDFGEAMRGGSPYKPKRAVFLDGETPVAVAQCLEWSLMGRARIVKMVRGPLLLGDEAATINPTVMRLLKDTWPIGKLNWFLQTPETPDTRDAAKALRDLGLRRVVTGYGTAWLDLTKGVANLRTSLHQKWRNQLRQGERSKLRVRQAQAGASLEWVLERHEEHRKAKRLNAPTGGFAALLCVLANRSRDVLVLTAEDGSEPVAGVLFLRHGNTATYYVAWTSPTGRRMQAHNLLVWRGIEALAEDGVEWLDLGGIDASMPGVSRFKLGIGGEPVTLCGTWM